MLKLHLEDYRRLVRPTRLNSWPASFRNSFQQAQIQRGSFQPEPNEQGHICKVGPGEHRLLDK